eukprot:scpid79047/ scgid34298/ 
MPAKWMWDLPTGPRRNGTSWLLRKCTLLLMVIAEVLCSDIRKCPEILFESNTLFTRVLPPNSRKAPTPHVRRLQDHDSLFTNFRPHHTLVDPRTVALGKLALLHFFLAERAALLLLSLQPADVL